MFAVADAIAVEDIAIVVIVVVWMRIVIVRHEFLFSGASIQRLKTLSVKIFHYIRSKLSFRILK